MAQVSRLPLGSFEENIKNRWSKTNEYLDLQNVLAEVQRQLMTCWVKDMG